VDAEIDAAEPDEQREQGETTMQYVRLRRRGTNRARTAPRVR
jgi:hypothetical protein